jgi:GyrI-like small molecule binding domain
MALPFGVRQKPSLVEMPPQRVAVVRSVGDPNVVGAQVFPALFGSVYTLKFKVLKPRGVQFKVSAPRARWPSGMNTPKDEWVGLWAIPVPDDTEELPQTVPDVPVALDTWEYGTVAHILHTGSYAEELPTIERLQAFIAESGYEIAGDHEEEYLSRPEAKHMKTIVRYPVRPRPA